MHINFHDNSNGDYSVFWKTKNIGTVSLHQNKFHASTCHLGMNLSTYDVGFAPYFGEQLSALVQMPLQIMLESDKKDTIRFLETAGFRCKRKCYEAEVTEKDLVKSIQSDYSVTQCHAGEPDYLGCVALLYRYYQDTHKEISPLTASFAEFSKEIPKTAFFMRGMGALKQAILVEKNEIAYCCTSDINGFRDFASVLVKEMFSQFPTLFFEADDCDPAAMKLLSLFSLNLKKSYNTYIKENSKIGK